MTIPGETEPNASPTRGRLRVVGPEPAAGGEAPRSASARPRSFWIACALGVAVVLLGLELASSRATVRALTTEITGLRADLAYTRDQLAAHRARLGEVRSRVGELRQRIGSLDALLATEPGTRAPSEATAPETASGAH